MQARAFLVAVLAGACASPLPVPYRPSRFDYQAFRERTGPLREPNYLPWMMHREVLPGGEPALVACRWPDDAFPLRYHVVPPALPSALQDEFHPRDPREYVNAVQRAFETWEKAIGPPVRFRPVEDPAGAALVVHLGVERLEEGEGQVLGLLHGEAERCRVLGPGSEAGRVRIAYAVHDAYLYVADRLGLLTPRQLEVVALHEIGHVLGASAQHSPLRGDIMYRIADDRRVLGLSEHDRNSFHALYHMPPGTVYVRLRHLRPRPPEAPGAGPRELGPEIRDARFGFRVRLPEGWQVIRSERGWVAVDGLSWDYEASLQVIALRGSLAGYLRQQGRRRIGPDADMVLRVSEMDGRPVGRLLVGDDEHVEVTAVLDWQPGWILMLISECGAADYARYAPGFREVLRSLQPLEPPAAGGGEGGTP